MIGHTILPPRPPQEIIWSRNFIVVGNLGVSATFFSLLTIFLVMEVAVHYLYSQVLQKSSNEYHSHYVHSQTRSHSLKSLIRHLYNITTP